MGKGNLDAVLFLYVTSLTMMMRRWIGIPSRVVDTRLSAPLRSAWVRFRLGRRERNPQRLNLGEEEARPNAPSPSPDDRRGQLQASDGCPAAGGISSEPLNGARRKKGLTLQPPDCPTSQGLKHSNSLDWAGNEGLHHTGPRCLQRATSNPQRQHSLVGRPFGKDPG